MKRTRSILALAGLMLAAAVSALGAAPAAGVAVDSSPVLAVTGTNGALYAKHTSQAAFTNLGGYLIAAPGGAAVAPSLTQYVGVGGNGMLFQRTDTTDWRRLTTLEYKCTQVSLVLSTADYSTVYGACTASNGALYGFDFDGYDPAPVVSSLAKLTPNYTVAGQVSVTNGTDGPGYLFRGANFVNPRGDVGNIWAMDGDVPRENWDYTTQFPAASNYWQYEVWQAEGAIVSAYSVEADGYVDTPGMSIGSPAVVDQDVNAQVFVTGTNGAVYTQTITPDSGSAWTVIPAKTQFGPAASQAPMPF
jgi:hypothetical protein